MILTFILFIILNMDKGDFNLFIDDEENYIIVFGSMKTFTEEYIKLQNKYRDNNRDFDSFYDDLSEKLENRFVKIYMPDIYRHNYLHF